MTCLQKIKVMQAAKQMVYFSTTCRGLVHFFHWSCFFVSACGNCKTANCIHRKLPSSLKCSARTSSVFMEFEDFWKNTNVAANVLKVESPALPRPRKPPHRLEDGGVPSHSFRGNVLTEILPGNGHCNHIFGLQVQSVCIQTYVHY